MDEQSRRKFIKYGLASLGAFLGSAAVLTIDKATGFKIGEHKYGIGLSEANASCGASADCSGGGGQCGASADCSGGGGQCGASADCSGSGKNSMGSGQCGASASCSGGGGQCGASASCGGQ